MEQVQDQQIEAIEKDTQQVVLRAKSLIITSQGEYDASAEFLRAIKGIRKQIDNTFDESIKDAHKLHKNLVAKKKEHTQPLDEAERIVKSKSVAWIQEERRKAEEEQRKKEEEARREEDRLRKAKEEQERKWREKEEVKRKEAERLAAEGKAEEARKAEIEAQKAAEKAEERKEEGESVHVPVSVIEPEAQTASGQSIKKTWKCDVTNMQELCAAIGRGDLPTTMVKANMSELNALARAMKGLKQYPGLKFFCEEGLSVSNKKIA